jgi:hypothetical protein
MKEGGEERGRDRVCVCVCFLRSKLTESRKKEVYVTEKVRDCVRENEREKRSKENSGGEDRKREVA